MKTSILAAVLLLAPGAEAVKLAMEQKGGKMNWEDPKNDVKIAEELAHEGADWLQTHKAEEVAALDELEHEAEDFLQHELGLPDGEMKTIEKMLPATTDLVNFMDDEAKFAADEVDALEKDEIHALKKGEAAAKKTVKQFKKQAKGTAMAQVETEDGPSKEDYMAKIKSHGAGGPFEEWHEDLYDLQADLAREGVVEDLQNALEEIQKEAKRATGSAPPLPRAEELVGALRGLVHGLMQATADPAQIEAFGKELERKLKELGEGAQHALKELGVKPRGRPSPANAGMVVVDSLKALRERGALAGPEEALAAAATKATGEKADAKDLDRELKRSLRKAERMLTDKRYKRKINKEAGRAARKLQREAGKAVKEIEHRLR